jgi:hypothetical protein
LFLLAAAWFVASASASNRVKVVYDAVTPDAMYRVTFTGTKAASRHKGTVYYKVTSATNTQNMSDSLRHILG